MLSNKSSDIRKEIIDLAIHTGQGRLGTDFSVVEIIDAIYSTMNHRPDEPNWDERDIFILSKGHASLCLYTLLSSYGYFDYEDIKTLKKYKSNFGGHLDRTKIKGTEASTGSLGHGIGIAVGMALGLKIKNSKRRVYVLVGDGEANEGSVWESLMIAVNQKLDNLTIVFDVNQSQTRCLQLKNIDEISDKFGCDVEVVDGHDKPKIEKVLQSKKKDKPKVVVANTIKGYPCKTLIDNKFEWHNKVPNQEFTDIFLKELDGKVITQFPTLCENLYEERDLDDDIVHREVGQPHPQNFDMKSVLPKDGIYRRFWKRTGAVRYEWEYQDGKRKDGFCYGWYQDGAIKQISEWKDNKLHGKVYHYSEYGDLIIIEEYEDDIRVNHETTV